ncbi:MAG: hypothetical protein Q9162_003251 [Coniocarpon cinnabarinum]
MDGTEAKRRLMQEFKQLSKESWTNIELKNDNIMEWMVGLIVLNPDSQYYGGYFKAKMTFPKNYPYSPPDFQFLRPMFHPNVYEDGRLCISILHPPGEDEMSGELASERWSPVQSVESVLLSILSLLDDPEVNSPANVDAGVMLRKQPEEFKGRVKKDRDESKQDIPEGYEMPKHEDAFRTSKQEDEYLMSWEDSDEEPTFDDSDLDSDEADDDGDEDDTGDAEQ